MALPCRLSSEVAEENINNRDFCQLRKKKFSQWNNGMPCSCEERNMAGRTVCEGMCIFRNEVRFFKLKTYSKPKETKPFSLYTFADRQYTGFQIQFLNNLYRK
jgi:hypothetical protein